MIRHRHWYPKYRGLIYAALVTLVAALAAVAWLGL